MIGYTDLKKSAKHKMAGNWLQILLTVSLIGIIYVSLSVVSSSSDTLNLGDLLLLLLEGPVLIAFSAFMLQLIKTQKANVNDFFMSFANLIKWMLAGLWKFLWYFLWLLLFIVPGIIKYFSYSQYYFILADNPDADLRQALKTSIKMTKGYKGALFVVYLSFLNWYAFIVAIYVVAVWTLELGMAIIVGTLLSIPIYVYLVPYITGTFAEIYEYLKERAIAEQICSPDEFGIAEQFAPFHYAADKTDDGKDIEIDTEIDAEIEDTDKR